MSSTRTQEEQDLVLMILHLSRLYRRSVNRALSIHGMSDAQAMPVLLISRLGDGLRQGVLAEQLGVEGPSLVRQIDQLQAAGLVERRADPADGRAKTLHLTTNGHEFAQVIEKVLGNRRTQLLASLADAELSATLAALRKFERDVTSSLDMPSIGEQA